MEGGQGFLGGRAEGGGCSTGHSAQDELDPRLNLTDS